MKFILHEIKLWFKDKTVEPVKYEFLPNKINVITGDSTTGKTSFWDIIDYCLLSNKINIASTITDKVLWFGVCFTINDEKISIIRGTPTKGAGSSDVVFNYGDFPEFLVTNKKIAEARTILNSQFNIVESFKIYDNKIKTYYNISFRHFLLFNSLTQTIIDTPETYFDNTFYGKEEYEKILSSIFDFVIGAKNIEDFQSLERLREIERELTKINIQENTNSKRIENFNRDILSLINKSREFNFINYDEIIDEGNEVSIIEEIISLNMKATDNSNIFLELDNLNKERVSLQFQISNIKQYEREYTTYRNNLNKYADSLQPIEFLNEKLSDQLVESYESKLFVESLELSLKNIKLNLLKNKGEPIKVEGEVSVLNDKLRSIEARINELSIIKNNQTNESKKLIALGEIKNGYEQILNREGVKPIDKEKLESLNDEKLKIQQQTLNSSNIKFHMMSLLNESILRNYKQLTSIPTYKEYMTRFDEAEMVLKLYPPSNQLPFALTKVGSASNYMFMHLCFYLGLHEHIINIGQKNMPQFLFIDQPSKPYYEGNNDDKIKLLDAFKLLNSFMETITNYRGRDFQIFLIEHAPKEFWTQNKLDYFHLVDEFINGKGLIPREIF